MMLTLEDLVGKEFRKVTTTKSFPSWPGVASTITHSWHHCVICCILLCLTLIKGDKPPVFACILCLSLVYRFCSAYLNFAKDCMYFYRYRRLCHSPAYISRHELARKLVQ